jgi:hypothetical protein
LVWKIFRERKKRCFLQDISLDVGCWRLACQRLCGGYYFSWRVL